MSEVATHICANCGACNALEASFCGQCGHALLENSEDERSGDLTTLGGAILQHHLETSLGQDAWINQAPGDLESANSNGDDLEKMQARTQVPPEPMMQKRCAWCSGLSPWAAVVCEVCGARFPVPEQDAALRRAAEERMRQDEESLDFWRQRRRRGWRRFLV